METESCKDSAGALYTAERKQMCKRWLHKAHSIKTIMVDSRYSDFLQGIAEKLLANAKQ